MTSVTSDSAATPYEGPDYAGIGLGSHQAWGFSPALDLVGLRCLVHGDEVKDGSQPLNVLVAGSCDARHILRTVAQRRRWPGQPIHFYVFERETESLARLLLLMQVAYEWSIPLRQRRFLPLLRARFTLARAFHS